MVVRGRNKVGRGRKGQVEVENDQAGPGRSRKHPLVPTPDIDLIVVPTFQFFRIKKMDKSFMKEAD